jgi:hypothetical protein
MYIVASDLEPKGSRQRGDNRIALGKGNESMPHFALRAAASPKQISEKYDADGLSSARGHIVSPVAGADPFGSCRAGHFVGEGTKTSN